MPARVLLIFLFSCQFCFAQNWQPLGSGLNYWTTSMYSDSTLDKLIINGWFSLADSIAVGGVTSYDDSFHSLPPGFNTSCQNSGGGDVRVMHRYGSWIYFGGNFSCVSGHDNTHAIARWNGSVWDSVPGGGVPFQNGVVNDMTTDNNELYICGTFSSVGGVAANLAAKFDGTTWSAIGSNYSFSPNDVFNAIEFYHGNLYVGGTIHDSQGNLFRLAMWDGTNWHFLNTPRGGSAGIWDMEVFNDELYVCGEFYFADGNPGNSVMRWNDTTWRDVGGSVQDYASPWSVMKQMRVHDGKLYCIGNFQMVGNVEARGLASWDGNLWCGYNTDFLSPQPSQFVGPSHIEFFRDTMYVSGAIMFIDTIEVNFIAKWIGGPFVDTCGTAVGINEPSFPEHASVNVYPNPASTIMTFQFAENTNEKTLVITDHLGRTIWRKQTSGSPFEFPAYEFSDGMYFYSVLGADNSSAAQGKFIIQH
jgi:hypothetical protein